MMGRDGCAFRVGLCAVIWLWGLSVLFGRWFHHLAVLLEKGWWLGLAALLIRLAIVVICRVGPWRCQGLRHEGGE